MLRLNRPRPTAGDVVAGTSVALVLIPQSLAYAELAGLPPWVGLYAASIPLLVFALLASSPYLQTGPVAVTSLLTISALPDVADDQLVGLAALLALLVGVFRLGLGLLGLGRIVRVMSAPVVLGFTSGAAFVIACSQLPKALGADAPDGSVLERAWWAVSHPGQLDLSTVLLSAMTVGLVVLGRRLHARFPGVLVAVIIGIVISRVWDYAGAKVDEVPEGLPPFSLDLPWSETPTIAMGAAIIALVGFAEPASIARTFANETGETWDAGREMVASGVANVVAAFCGGYPVGGSFSRSSLNRLAGAESPMSGGITGLVVIAFLPFAGLLAPLPTAVLGAIVISAIVRLIKPRRLLGLWRRSRSQALLAWMTAGSVLLFAPRVERAVFVGVLLTVVLHAARGLEMRVTSGADDSEQVVAPVGLLWTGSATKFCCELESLAESNDRLTIDFSHAPFIDEDTVQGIASARAIADRRGSVVAWRNQPEGSDRLLDAIGDD